MNAIRNLLNNIDDVVRGGVNGQAISYVKNGARKTKVAANASVADQNMFQRAIAKTKGSKLNNFIFDGTGRKTVNESLDDATIKKLEDMRMEAKNYIAKGQKDSASTKAYQAQVDRADALISGKKYARSVGLGDRIMDYYGHEEYGTGRKIATVGAVVGAGLATRYATGGDLTHNGSGRRDIIGVPLV